MKYPHRLSHRIHVLGNLFLPTYLIRTELSCTLIEAGISSTASQVADQIACMKIDASSIQKLLITHGHADHLSGAPALMQLMPQLRVYASEGTLSLLKKEEARRSFDADDQEIGARLHERGIPTNSIATDFNLANLAFETLIHGQVLEIDDLKLEVIDARGHCLGGMAFWEPEERALFCSDYLGFFLPPDGFVPNFYVDFDDYMSTFDSLARLKPAYLCLGHTGVLSKGEATSYIDGARAEIERVCKFVTGRSSDPEQIQQTARELCQKYYVREMTMFSAEKTRYCSELLVRRILHARIPEPIQEMVGLV